MGESLSHYPFLELYFTGGVLFCDEKQRVIEKLKNDYQYDSGIIGQIMTSPESWELRRGKMPSDDFWKWAQEQLPEVKHNDKSSKLSN